MQAEVARNLYRLWFSTPQMAGIIWWNLADGTAVRSVSVFNENLCLGGLVDDDFAPKPSFHVLDRLINHEWKTQAAGKTDAKGQYVFRGFYGKYQVTVDTPKGPQKFEIDLFKDGDAHNKLTLKSQGTMK